MLLGPDVKIKSPVILGVLHVPPFLPPYVSEVSENLLQKIESFLFSETEKWIEGGVQGIFIQNGCHFPSSKPASPETLTILTRFGLKLRERFKVSLGINLEEHDVEGLTAIARAIPLDFVRIKVYLGAMVKADGIVEGCADKLQKKIWELGLSSVTTVMADVYDRTGVPLAAIPLEEMCRQAVVFGRADALIITGFSFTESLEMLKTAKNSSGVPIFLGGSSSVENLRDTFQFADGCVVYSSMVDEDGSLPLGWRKKVNLEKLKFYVNEAKNAWEESRCRD